MRELGSRQVRIHDDYWQPRLEMNARQAIPHQWEQLEQTGSIDNFRLAAGEKEGFREGWFFAGSDCFKWLDAASRAHAAAPSAELGETIDGFVDLLGQAQTEDGYLYTYNQIHFPDCRWMNLQIEHELYCHGHLIEAGVSHYEATGQRDLMDIAEKAAGLLVRDFLDAGPEGTPGHEEIEIALFRLYRATRNGRYLDLAERFIERRGRIRHFPWHILQQNQRVGRRAQTVREKREQYLAQHPEYGEFQLPPRNVSHKPPGIRLRYYLSALSGKYFQQHRPVRKQTVPVGHAVRFAYLETAVAMLCRERGDETLLPALEQAWTRMVERRMYVTGGIGSLPEIEGFGRDYELDPEVAYAETCAALGCLYWNWEMALLTREAKYADLFEWQLYNAASVGMGGQGRSYLYNNPLASRGGITRQAWYDVPCCPSNLSRTWASLNKYLYSYEGSDLWVHQYVGSKAEVDLGVPVRLEVQSALPWRGDVTIRLEPESAAEFTLHLRIPSWCGSYSLAVNGDAVRTQIAPEGSHGPPRAVTGYSPQGATYLPITGTWSPGDTLVLSFSMPVTARHPHPKVRSQQGKVALTRGPLVYCLESVDNPGLDLFEIRIDPSTLRPEFRAELGAAHIDGLWVLRGKTMGGEEFTAIPYYAWANRGESQMTVMLGV
jgi:DUF1680 family protein